VANGAFDAELVHLLLQAEPKVNVMDTLAWFCIWRERAARFAVEGPHGRVIFGEMGDGGGFGKSLARGRDCTSDCS